MKRLLIVNVNWMGDVLFSTPAIRALRKKYPSSFIACLVPPRCEAVIKNNPHLNEVIVFPDKIAWYRSWQYLKLIFELRKRNFDTAIFFHRSRTKAWMARLAGIPKRIGFSSGLKKGALTHFHAFPKKPIHKTDTFLQLLTLEGIPTDGRAPDFFVSDKCAKVEGVDSREPYMVVHAGGNWDLKRWPVTYFVQWIALWLKNFPGKVILCGTEGERAISEEILRNFKDGRVVNLSGKTSLDELALLLKNAKLLLSNDSGPIHLAASLGTPIVGLYGPTHPELTGPISRGTAVIMRKDVGCEIPCYFRSCNYRVCMLWLTPEEVFEKARSLAETKQHAQT